MAHIQTTGPPMDAQAAGSSPPQRREIRDLIADRVSFSLYIQALSRMQATDQSDDSSYYRIAGIHGLPFEAWQNSGGTGGVTETGYCTHSNVLFPTWRRPYLALYEQILCKHAKDIADEPNMPTAWKEAAANLRQPYWDWAANLTPPREVLQLRNLSILQPDGIERNVINPLFSYRFADTASSFADVDETFRQVAGLTTTHARQITRQTYNLLIRVNDWFDFSTNAADGVSATSSLESIHDDLHGTIGGFMGSVPYAAFDPIFWLHHCNTDRIFALWQVLHPAIWVTPSSMGSSSTWTISAQSTVDGKTPLTPFYDGSKADDYWISEEVKTLSRFGYTYPELAAITNAPNPSLALLPIITDLYGGADLALFAERFRLNEVAIPEVLRSAASTAAEPVDAGKTFPKIHATLGDTLMEGSAQMALLAMAPGLALQSFIAKSQMKVGDTKQTVLVAPAPAKDTETGLKDWSARVRVEKYALNESFQVCIFLVPEGIENSTISETDAKGWYESDYFVGQFCAFVNGTHRDMCKNCVDQREKHIVIEGHVPLDDAIVGSSGLKSFDDEVVHPYLTKNLVWRCKKLDGTVVPMDKIPSLEVSVWSSMLKFDPHNTEAVLPDWTTPHCHESITAGQPGGCKDTTHGHSAAAAA